MPRAALSRALRSLASAAIGVLVSCSGGDAPPPANPAVVTPARLRLANDSVTVRLGRSLLLQVGAYDAAGSAAPLPAVTWSSDAPAVVSVDAVGWVRALAPGRAVVRAAAGALGDSAVVVVERVPVASIALAVADSVVVGDSAIVVATIVDEDGARVSDRVMSLRTSDSTLAFLDVTGHLPSVVGRAPGTVMLQAEIEGVRASRPVRVVAPRLVAAAFVGGDSLHGVVGELLGRRVSVRATGANGSPVAGTAVVFELDGGGASDPVLAVTDRDGIAATQLRLGTRAGRHTLRATVGTLPPLVAPVTAAAAATATIVLRTEPGDARAGEAMRQAAVLETLDRYGNRATDAVPVTASVSAGPGAAAGESTVRARDGEAVFRQLAVTGPVGERRVRFSAPDVASVESRPFMLRPSTRSTVDRPDDLDGAQVHVMYLVPRDGVDRGLDTLPDLAYSVAVLQRWIAEQRGGRTIRFDTWRGALDVSFRRLSMTKDQIFNGGPHGVIDILAELNAGGTQRPDRIYAVYVDASANDACGGATWVPNPAGRGAAIFLGSVPNGVACATGGFASSPLAAPGYLEYAMLHDVLHTFGLVSASAPNYNADRPAHVREPKDLMFGGPGAWQFQTGLVVDIGGDDYEGPLVRAGLPTFSNSPFVGVGVPLLASGFYRSAGDRAAADARPLPTMPPPHPPFSAARP